MGLLGDIGRRAFGLPPRKTIYVVHKTSGCYIATAVYGSYDCPEVWILRRYRDLTLSKNLFGRAFICLYYAFSPTVVKWFGQKKWFNKFWRGVLDQKIKILQERGIDDSPYDDYSKEKN
ncbi:CFI-box-CTERM domain-containing protein [Breznakiellaceae bacterium SP9]